ncbi:hypothetical protein [Pseudoduganella sp.]|uniref:DUF6928 family protein n=1 Tax=Pseudoduganella sp. TaxID=1880898 RepID=UPI0035ADB802
MGAKTWMLMYAESEPAAILRARPVLDRAASQAMLEQLFPGKRYTPQQDETLARACPHGRDVRLACFPGLSIVAAGELAIDNPSQLDPRFLEYAGGRTVYLHIMYSVVDWFAYAIWKDGQWQRSLSVTPDGGVIEDLGERRAFELPYWAGKFPAIDPADDEPDTYPLPFHPLDLGEAALEDLFGYQLEGDNGPSLLDPASIPLMAFKAPRWWKFW